MSEDGRKDDGRGRANIEPRLLAMIESVNDVPWFHMAHLRVGEVMEVKFKAGLVTMTVVDPAQFRVMVKAQMKGLEVDGVDGAVFGTTITGTGNMLQPGALACGLWPVIWVKGKGEFILPPIESISVGGVEVLPMEPLGIDKSGCN